MEPSIDERMEKVSLVAFQMDPNSDDEKNIEVLEANMEAGDGVSNGLVGEVKDDGVSEVCSVNDPIKVANESDEEESGDESEDETEDSSSESSSSSSTSSSSSDDEEDEEEKVVAFEVEEGEINGDDLDEVILGSDVEEDIPKGPIKSKHEIEDLPPVPPLEVSLELRHQTLPVGFLSSILGNRVIVEGSEKHSPLNEGSILWITESRLPLGRIDEIFGPVKNPYYIVRYNSDKEVPPGISIGVAISFVVDFANHILNEKYLYEKGYDASGVDDEEDTEAEFSDDEKEAEYKRSLRQNKRNTNHGNQECGFGKKKTNFKSSVFHGDQPSASQPSQVHAPPAVVNSGCSDCQCAHGGTNSGKVDPLPTMVPAFPSQPQAFQMGISSALGNTSLQFNTTSTQGFPPQPQPIHRQGGGFAPQSYPVGIQGGFPPQPQPMGMQGGFPQPQPMGMQGGFPPQPQFTTTQGLPMNWLSAQQFGDQTCNLPYQNQVFNNFAGGILPYPQQLVPNIGALPGNLPWFAGSANPSLFDPSSALAGLMGQGVFGQVPFGCGNVNPQGPLTLSNEQSLGQAPLSVNLHEMRPPSMQFNNGRPSSRGRRPYQRGGRRFFGRRGGSQHNG